MADLGVLTTVVTDFPSTGKIDPVTTVTDDVVSQALPLWLGEAALNLTQDGEITGKVTTQGIATAGIRVTLHYRKTGMMIAAAVTDANGDYRFTGLNRAAADYFVVAMTQAPFNALIYDKITPQEHGV